MNDYRKGIDVLRALAVSAVVLYHAKFQFFEIEILKGGYLGVDIFFVISGYLISRNLFKELKDKNSINFKSFYIRRIKRLIPILMTVIAFFYFVAFIYYSPWGFLNFSKSVLSSMFFFSNFYFSRTSTVYGSEDSLYIPFLHSWSLSVEEQFYLLFPLVFFLIFKFRKNNLLLIISCTLVGSFIFSIFLESTQPELNFFNFFSRIWEILAGSIIAYFEIFNNKLYLQASQKNLSSYLTRVSYLGLIICFLFFNEKTFHPSHITLLPIIFTTIIIINRNEESQFFERIYNKYFISLGLISYSLYLWHYPLFSFTRLYFRRENELFTNEVKFFLILFSIIISIFSYKYIELPFRKRKDLKFVLFFSSILLVVSLSSYNSYGFEKIMTQYKYQEDLTAYKLISEQLNTSLYENMIFSECKHWSKEIDQNFLDILNNCSKKHSETILILGDSHAMNLYNIFALSDKYRSVIGLSQGFCRPHNCKEGINNQYEDFENTIDKIDNFNVKVIFHQSGSHLLKDKYGINESEEIFVSGRYVFDDESIEKIVLYLEKLNKKNIEIIWIGPFPEFRYKLEDVIENQSKWTINPISMQVFNNLDTHLTKAVQNKSFKYLRFNDVFKLSKKAFINVDKKQCFQFIDQDHFSRCGEINLSKNIKDF